MCCLPWFCRFSFYETISLGGGGSIITSGRTRFTSGVPPFGPEPLKFYPAVGFCLSAKSIHEKRRRFWFRYLDAIRAVPSQNHSIRCTCREMGTHAAEVDMAAE